MSDGELDADILHGLPDDELMAELTAIPGIGPWTVQGGLTAPWRPFTSIPLSFARLRNPRPPGTQRRKHEQH